MSDIHKVSWRKQAKPRRSPYWKLYSTGRYIGWRKMSADVDNPGKWLAKAWDGSRYPQERLGALAKHPEDEKWDAAVEAARKWFDHLDKGGSTSPHTVGDAARAYVEKLRAEEGDAAADNAEGFMRRLVNSDPIAKVLLSKLTAVHCKAYRARVLAHCNSNKSSFNRCITPLRAALNLAHEDGKVASDLAWLKAFKPFKGPGATNRRTLYLNAAQRRSLIENTSEEARPLLQAMSLLPVRPGDIPRAKVKDLDIENRALKLAGKGNERTIPLSGEALAHFAACARGKLPSAWLIARANGAQWDRFAWRDEIKLAAAAAKLPRAVVATVLRHSTITDLVKGGLDIFHVAKLAGTSVSMIERHYGHLQNEHARRALEKLSAGVRM